MRRGEDALARTPDQLQVLKDAGVVDAGGAGLVELVRGVASAVSGEPIPEPAPIEEHLSHDAIHQELSQFRYCTVFLIEGEDLDRDALEDELEQLGDSLLVVGDEHAIKVHVHTDDPGAALSIGTKAGTIDRIEIANMHEQTQQREERLLSIVPDAPPAQSGVVAVVAGDGQPQALREPRRAGRPDLDRRRRPDDEPVDRGPAARGAVARRRRGNHPPEQLEHRPRRRARRRERRPHRRGRPGDVDPRGARGDGRLRRLAHRRREREARCARRSRPSRRAK